MNKPAIASAVAAGLVGLAIGAATQVETTAAPAKAPEPETRTVTKTVTEQVAPQSCLDLADHAERLVNLQIKTINLSGEAVQAASTFDAAGLNRITAKVSAITPKVKDVAPLFWAAQMDCKAAAK